MQLGKLFEENKLSGKPGLYPFTPESLIRVGLAICLYLKIGRGIEKPVIAVKGLDFLTLSLSVGFMSGGGDACIGCKEGNVKVSVEKKGEEASLIIEGLQEHEFRMIESMLFSRYNMPKAEGEKIGRIWIRGEEL